MDESGSVGKDEFTKEKTFVKALAEHFQFGPSAARFGVISYSTGSQLDIAFNRYHDLASFQRGVSAIQYKGITVLKELFVLKEMHLYNCNIVISTLFLKMAKGVKCALCMTDTNALEKKTD